MKFIFQHISNKRQSPHNAPDLTGILWPENVFWFVPVSLLCDLYYIFDALRYGWGITIPAVIIQLTKKNVVFALTSVWHVSFHVSFFFSMLKLLKIVFQKFRKNKKKLSSRARSVQNLQFNTRLCNNKITAKKKIPWYNVKTSFLFDINSNIYKNELTVSPQS